jgi:putative PIN family toxin of toxin-antitoxin system
VKVVLDTNVFVSGVFFSGPPFQILQAWRDEKIQLAISPEILDEYRRVGETLAEEHPSIDLGPMLEY